VLRRKEREGGSAPTKSGKGKGGVRYPRASPLEKVGRGLRPIKDGIKISRKGKCPRNRKIRLKIGIAKAFGG